MSEALSFDIGQMQAAIDLNNGDARCAIETLRSAAKAPILVWPDLARALIVVLEKGKVSAPRGNRSKMMPLRRARDILRWREESIEALKRTGLSHRAAVARYERSIELAGHGDTLASAKQRLKDAKKHK